MALNLLQAYQMVEPGYFAHALLELQDAFPEIGNIQQALHHPEQILNPLYDPTQMVPPYIHLYHPRADLLKQITYDLLRIPEVFLSIFRVDEVRGPDGRVVEKLVYYNPRWRTQFDLTLFSFAGDAWIRTRFFIDQMKEFVRNNILFEFGQNQAHRIIPREVEAVLDLTLTPDPLPAVRVRRQTQFYTPPDCRQGGLDLTWEPSSDEEE
jgi:hypothetical protein